MSENQLVKSVPFLFEGKIYNVKVMKSGYEFSVRTYLDEKPANGYLYTVSETENYDFNTSQGVFAYDHLVSIAKRDVEERVWEKYLEAIEKSLP